jgi:hypothetical protein
MLCFRVGEGLNHALNINNMFISVKRKKRATVLFFLFNQKDARPLFKCPA